MQTDLIADLKVKSEIILCVSHLNNELLSSNIASFSGGANGVYRNPTKARRLLRLIIYTICNGAPKSRVCFNSKGYREYILKPLFVASDIHE